MRIILREKGIEYPACDAPRIKTPEDAVKQAPEIMESETEAFGVILLNAQNKMISCEIVTTGIIDASLVHPREVFRSAISHNACGMVLLHNHPSGDPTPSADDIRVTKQLIEAGRIVDIKVLDHVILSHEGRHISLREEGICRF